MSASFFDGFAGFAAAPATALPIPARLVASAWELLEVSAHDAFGSHEVCAGLSYTALVREASRVADLFVRDGLAPGARVAVLVPLGQTWLAAAFGAWKAGLAVCVDVCADVSADAGADGPAGAAPVLDAAVVDSAALTRLLTSGAEMPARIYVTDFTGPIPPGLLDFEAEAPSAAAPPALATAVAFTRGGLAATHAQLLAGLAGLQDRLRLRAPARVLAPASAEDPSWPVAALLLPVAAGATIVFGGNRSAAALAELIRTQSISHAFPDLALLVELAIPRAPEPSARPPRGAAAEILGGTLGGLAELLATRLTPEHALTRAVAGLQGNVESARATGLEALVTTSTDPRLAELMALGLPILRAWAPPGALGFATLQDGLPPRADSLGRPLRGVEVTALAPDASGVGALVVSGPAFGGTLQTQVRGRIDASLHVLAATPAGGTA